MRHLVVVSCFLSLAMSLSAQVLSVSVNVDPAPIGTPITVSVQGLQTSLFTPFGCLAASVHSGTPGGPVVRVFPCTFLPGAIPLCGGTTFRTVTWNQTITGNVQAPAGVYWFKIDYQPMMFGGPISTEWACVTIHDVVNPVPSLQAVNTPNFGAQFSMQLDAPANPFDFYAVVLSATTNVGTPFPGGFACLDNDFLLQLTLNPPPVFFQNFAGLLDGFGTAVGINMNIPAVSGITCLPLHAQAAVVSPVGAITLSNDLKFTIR